MYSAHRMEVWKCPATDLFFSCLLLLGVKIVHGWKMLALVKLGAPLSVRHRNNLEENECFLESTGSELWVWQNLFWGGAINCQSLLNLLSAS